MSMRLRLSVGLILILLVPSVMHAQQNPAASPDSRTQTAEPSTTDSTYRSAAASGIEGFDETLRSPRAMTNSQWNRYMKKAENLGQRTARLAEKRHDVTSIPKAQQFAGKYHTQLLGTVAAYADVLGTAGGYYSVGDYRGAAVAVIDDVAEGLYAAGGAALAGAIAGSSVGPLGTVGGAVVGLAGAAVGSIGYNAFISPDVTNFAAEVLGEPQGRDFFNQAVANRVEHVLNTLTPVDEYLVQTLTQKLREQDALAAEAAGAADRPPPVSIQTPPPFDAKGRKYCPHCGGYH